MGSRSEREYSEKINEIRRKLNKRTRKIRESFGKIEKMKVDALRKAEEIKRSGERDIQKIERNITKSKDLAPESKKRLSSEIMAIRSQIGQEYTDLKVQISETLVPV